MIKGYDQRGTPGKGSYDICHLAPAHRQQAKAFDMTRQEVSMNIRRIARAIGLTAVLLGMMVVGSPQVARAEAQQDIIGTAIAAGSFKTLVAAVQAAGLAETLRGPGPFTVFAPTDEAFAKLPAGTLENLLKPENKAKLQAILTYHVVSGKVTAADVLKMTSAKTVNGQSVIIDAKSGTVMVDNARVVKTDVAASNGIIHVIDTVILPKDE